MNLRFKDESLGFHCWYKPFSKKSLSDGSGLFFICLIEIEKNYQNTKCLD